MRCVPFIFSSVSHWSLRATRHYSSNNLEFHVPVMHKEVLAMFQPQTNQKFLDLTFGAGGHTRKLLNSASNITVYTLDRDPLAYELAIQLASKTLYGQVTPLLGKFSDLPELLPVSGNLVICRNCYQFLKCTIFLMEFLLIVVVHRCNTTQEKEDFL
jgi:ubiquinone/menaquinone biosynthesis C-methylase UbiE